MIPYFSIICPVYSMKGGLGERFLVEYLSHLQYQTFKDFEVIVSDQSTYDTFEKICDTFSHILNVKIVKNTSNKNTAANNVNNGIKHASGKLVKLLYVDDFFSDPNALLKIKNAFESNPDKKWLISGFMHCDEERVNFSDARMPRYDQLHVLGDNTTGNPSNYTVRRECALEMDEGMRWLVDGEYFYRSYHHYGLPITIPEILVCFREHGDSKFNDETYRELDAKERAYCLDKYSRSIEHKLI